MRFILCMYRYVQYLLPSAPNCQISGHCFPVDLSILPSPYWGCAFLHIDAAWFDRRPRIWRRSWRLWERQKLHWERTASKVAYLVCLRISQAGGRCRVMHDHAITCICMHMFHMFDRTKDSVHCLCFGLRDWHDLICNQILSGGSSSLHCAGMWLPSEQFRPSARSSRAGELAPHGRVGRPLEPSESTEVYWVYWVYCLLMIQWQCIGSVITRWAWPPSRAKREEQ